MADIQTVFIDFDQGADFALEGLLLADDDGLTTAVIISLFTDRKARKDDVLPDERDDDRRGFWADELSTVPGGDQTGSLLWLNDASKQLASVLKSDRKYAEDALQWMIDDQVVSQIDVTAFSPRSGIRALLVAIHRPSQPVIRYQFDNFWNNLNG